MPAKPAIEYDPSVLFSGSDSPLLFSITTDFQLIYFNESFQLFFEKETKTNPSIGSDIKELIPANSRFSNLLSNIEVGLNGTATKSRDQFAQWYESSITPFYENKKLKGASIVMVPANHLAEQERLLKNLNIAADYTQNGVMVLDSKGNVLWLNSMFSRLTGYSTSDPLHQKIQELVVHGIQKRKTTLWKDLIRDKKAIVREMECPRKDGSTFWCELKVTPIIDEQHRFDGYLIIISDIQERKFIEEELKASNEWIHKINNSIPGAVVKYKVNPDGTDELLYISSQVMQIWGITRKEAMDDIMNLWNRIFPDDIPLLQTSLEASAKDLAFWHEEWRIFGPGDEIKWLDGRGNPYQGEDGAVIWDMIFLDITNLKNTQHALTTSKERYKSILNAVEGVFWETSDPEHFQLSFVSNKITDLLGYSKEEWLDKVYLWEDLIDPSQKADVVNTRKKGLRARSSHDLEYKMRHKKGHYIWVRESASYSPVEEPFIARGFLIDITQQKSTEEKLQLEETRSDGILEAAKAGSWVLDLKENDNWINDRWANMLGYELSEIQPLDFKKFESLVHPNDLSRMQSALNKHLNQKTEFYDTEFRLKRKDGSWSWIHSRGRIIEYEDGKPRKLSGIHMDINQRKEAESERIKTEEQLKLAVETGKIGIWKLDLNTNEVDWNEQQREIFGVDEDEVIWLETFKEFVVEEDFGLIEEGFNTVLSNQSIEDYRFRIKLRNGNIRHIFASTSPVLDEDGQVGQLIGVNLDITRLVETESSLLKTLDQKNRLFQELHHRVKNNLQLVSSLLYLKSRLFTDPSTSNFIKDTNSRIMAIAKVHEQLLHLEEQDRLAIKKYLENLSNNLLKSYVDDPTSIQVQLDIEDHVFNIDKAMLIGLITHEALTNSMKYAFPDGKGAISVSLKKVGEQFTLILKDDGQGVEFEEMKEKNSIGLALIRDFTKQLGGELAFSNDPGCTYTIQF